MGGFGLWPNALYSSPVLMQLVSVTGFYGLTFLMAWFSSTAAWAWEQQFAWSKVWRGLAIFSACLALICVYGNIRLGFFHPEPGTVRVHQLMNSDDELAIMSDANLPAFLSKDPAAFSQRTSAVHQKYIDDTIREAKAGAQIVAWPEVAGVGDEKVTAALLVRGKEVARQEGIYLVLPTYTVYPDASKPIDNRMSPCELNMPSGVVSPNQLAILHLSRFGGWLPHG